MDLLITEINNAGLGWEADRCKLQKKNPAYDQACSGHIEGPLTLAQTKADTIQKYFGDKSNEKFKEALKKAQKF